MGSEHSLASIAPDAERLSGEISLGYSDGEFWLILPDGAIGCESGDSSLTAMKLPTKRHAVLLLRQLFLKHGACTLDVLGRKVIVEFRPAIIAGRTRDGRRYARPDTSLPLPDGQDEFLPAPAEIPDPGDLLCLLEKSTKTLEAIDDLLTDPSVIVSDDVEKRQDALKKISDAKDKALTGLCKLGGVLAQGDDGDHDSWLAAIAEASGQMVEAMADIEGLPPGIKESKLRLLDELKHKICGYFANVDQNSEEMKKFSTGISTVVLEERRDVVAFKKSKIENDIETTYASIINVIQSVSPKGSGMSLLPLPEIEGVPRFWCKIILNMHHLVMAVQYCGFHMRAEVAQNRSRRIWHELRAWDAAHPPRIHLVSNSEAVRKIGQCSPLRPSALLAG